MPKVAVGSRERHSRITRSLEKTSAQFAVCPTVPVDEIAFALSLFVAAASGSGPQPKPPRNSAQLSAVDACRRVLLQVCSQGSRRSAPGAPIERNLASTFLTLWQHYEGDPLQRSICVRVLGFYLLTERSAGLAIKTWVTASEDHPDTVVLHPAIVEALATVPLQASQPLTRTPFLALVNRIASQMRPE